VGATAQVCDVTYTVETETMDGQERNDLGKRVQKGD